MSDNTRYNELQKASLVTIAANGLLASAKLAIGLLSGSTAVVSDAAHAFSDTIVTIIVLAGLKLSNQKADAEHPYGHFRIESLVSLLLSVILAVTALFLGYAGIKKLNGGDAAEASVPALLITAISILSKECMFQYAKRKAKKHGSTSLMSDAWHHRSDALSSIAVLTGVGGVFFGAWFLDPAAAVVVCLILFKASFDIAKTAVYQLIDHSAGIETQESISQAVISVEGVRAIESLRTRVSNNVIFVELEILADPFATIAEGHEIAKKIRNTLAAGGTNIEHCTISVNPDSNGF